MCTSHCMSVVGGGDVDHTISNEACQFLVFYVCLLM